MKLVIQIPCYNEEETIGITLSGLPRKLPGIDTVQWLVIDDGCTDRTVEMALANGVDHIVRLPRNQGLSRAFTAGLEASIAVDADIIVNIDADNQYCADDIPTLIEPIISGKAEIVIGARPISQIREFSIIKKMLQRLGSWVVRLASNTDIPDATSGFRAFSRSAAMGLNVFNEYTYTLETLIQAGQKGMAITSVPVRTNECLRPSRLVKSVPYYIGQSILTILRISMTYRPLKFFAVPGLVSFSLGMAIGLRFLYYYVAYDGAGHVQSVILSALLLGIGFFLIVVAMVADLISVNRKLLEKVEWRLKEMEENINSQKGNK